jgi:hypothetical protein
VENDQLVISVGVEVLAYALQNGPDEFGATILDAHKFAEDVASALENDSSEGDTALQKLLDNAAQNAVENGSQYVRLDSDPAPSVYPPERS